MGTFREDVLDLAEKRRHYLVALKRCRAHDIEDFFRARREMKLKQKDMAVKLGIGGTHLCTIEKGKKPLSGRLLGKLAELFKAQDANLIQSSFNIVQG